MTKIGVTGRLVALVLLVWVTACARDGATAATGGLSVMSATLRMATARTRQKAPGYCAHARWIRSMGVAG